MKQINQTHYITPDELRIGYYVHLDLGWMDHPFTFSNFLIKNEEQISKIRALKLYQVRYDPERSTIKSKVEAETFPKTVQADWSPKATAVPKTSVVQQANRLNQLNNIRLHCEASFTKNANTAREAARILMHHPEHAKKLAENLVDEMVSSIITENDVALHAISSGASAGNANHTVNVAVLALMLAKNLDISQGDAATLGIASIFHDVGKTDNNQKKSYVDLHCEAGARIARHAGFSERISNVILQHHEFSDGSGYPMQLRNDAIDSLAKILIIANYYDNLCNPDNATEAMTPYEAIQHMYVYKAQKFDSALLKRFIKILGVYPSGSVVQLSNYDYGIVMTTNPNKPLQPLVMVYKPTVARETPVIINLSEETNLSIKHCLNPSKLPQEVFNYLRPSKRINYYFHKHDAPSTIATEIESRLSDGSDLQRAQA